MYGRLEGAPIASDLGLKGAEAMLYERIMTNHHHGQSAERTLADCKCVQITGAEVVPGDFRYHYSKQLDAFILWEVIKVDRERHVCEVKTIDEDSPEVSTYWDGEQTLSDGFNKFYRPDPADREQVERKGFASDYVGGLHSWPTQRRHLTLKLNLFKPSKQIYAAPQEERFLQKVRRWLLGY